MLDVRWSGKSLRFWIALSMAIALAPVAISAFAGYFLLDRDVVTPFRDVSIRFRDQSGAVQHLRVSVWDTLVPVDEFIDEGGAHRPQTYRTLRQQIEQSFANIQGALSDDEVKVLLERARDEWTIADRIASEIISVSRLPGDPETAKLMERFHGAIAATSDKIGAVYLILAEGIEADHNTAILAYEHSVWLAGIAGILSLLAMAGGAILIGRIMSGSVDRLVDGASRFASGDREHRIEVRIPPELRRVAEEFNRMIARISETESALSELARRDGLTRLLNRRAFDEALSETMARVQRTGDNGALLSLDIDHFKQINDTYGHGAGDEVLRVFARSMMSVLRPFDQAFRVGGEEFSVLLPSASLATAEDLAERVRETVAAMTVMADGQAIAVTVSIGVVGVSKDSTPGEWTESADAALYRAKASGRNRTVVVDLHGMHEASKRNHGNSPAN